MFFIPYGNIRIKSYLKGDEIERRLKEQLEPHSILSGAYRKNHKYFQGRIENGQFKISRIINYRNSFTPVIVGKVQHEIDHTIIDLTVRLDFVVLAILLFIIFEFPSSFVLPSFSFLLLLSGEAAEFLQYLQNGYVLLLILSLIGIIILGIGSLFILFYLFVMIPFNIETDKATKYLEALFVSHKVSE